MKLLLSKLHPDPVNVRHVATKKELDPLVASMKARGLLCPIVVRPNGGDDEWLVTAGSRRVAAARKLGWTEIEAVTLPETSDEDATVISAAENMVRKGMHAVDQWKAIRELTEKGLSIQAAADALGLGAVSVRRMALLGSLSPKLLNQMAKEPGLPQTRDLRVIAQAPLSAQESALAQVRKDIRAGDIDEDDEESAVSFPWFQVASLCSCVRIPRDRAIFDLETAGVAFEEDLFAEPGSEEQFTCSDVGAFIAAQQAALEAEAEASKGRMVVCDANGNQQLVPPPGYVISYGDAIPKRPTKNDPRKVAKAVIRAGYMVGAVIERVIRPKEEEPATEQEPQLATERPAQERAERDPISKPVQGILATMKTEALGKAIDECVPILVDHGTWPDIVRLLLLAFTAINVDLRTADNDGWNIRCDVAALTHRGQLAKAIVRLLKPLIKVNSPLPSFGTSGPAAEWIGKMLNADAYMERCDTDEILKGLRRDKLVEIATEHGFDATGTATAIRVRLVGNLPKWRPVEFDAPIPEVEEEDGP